MKYLIILILIFVYILFGNELGYTKVSPIYTHITYMFQHASILHLIFNSFVFIGIYTSLERFINRWIFLCISFFVAVITSFGAMYDKPTVGLSSVVYSMLGLYIGITLISKKAKIADTPKYLLFIVCIIISLTISYFKDNSNFILHLCSLLCGLIISVLYSIWINKKLKQSVRSS